MIDLTTREEDKDNFILKVYLKEESPKYGVLYASGRQEEFDFTIHNLNATLLTMERQYHEFKEKFFYEKAAEANKAALHKLIEGLLAIIGVALTVSVDMSSIIKLFISLIIVVCSIFYQKTKTIENAECGRAIDVLAITENFLKNKDQFKIKVTDPITKTEEDWYLLTLSEIEMLEDKREVTVLSKTITDEMRAEESANTTATLKKKWRLSD